MFQNLYMPKTLPKELTSYDLVKCFAVILMIIDHTGYYFFPEEDWWRILGRFCVPVWFFLIGYAKSRDIGPGIWIGGFILLAANFAAGHYIFPLNILFTIILIRLLIDPVMQHALTGTRQFWALNMMLFLLILPSSAVTEYGTQGLILAMFGYLIRHTKNRNQNTESLLIYLFFCLAGFVILQALIFGFTQTQFAALTIGTLAVMGILYFFKLVTYPGMTRVLPNPVIWILQFGGRRTLEIYVAHLLLFNAWAIMVGRF